MTEFCKVLNSQLEEMKHGVGFLTFCETIAQAMIHSNFPYRKARTVTVALILVLATLQVNSIPLAHASTPPSTNFTLNTASTCLQLGGSIPFGDFCDISGLTIPSGYSVTITKAGGDGTLTAMGFTGTNVNYGTINIDSSVGTGVGTGTEGYSTLNNYGTINIGLVCILSEPGFVLFVNHGGTINNYGTVNNNCGMINVGFNNGFGLISEGILNNYGTFNNIAALFNQATDGTPGTINNYPAGIFNNYNYVSLYPSSVFGNQGTVNDYCGGTFQGTPQGTGTFTGNPAISLCTQQPTSTQVSPNPSSVIIGNTVTFTATVSGSAGTPTGVVSWGDGGAGGSFSDSASCTLASGSCSVVYTPNNVAASVTITAAYGGDADDMGSSGSSSLMVITPAQAIGNLVTLKESMNLPQGTANSLDAKLNAALDSVNRGQFIAARNQLEAFINEVNAQTGKHMTVSQANQLIASANEIISALP